MKINEIIWLDAIVEKLAVKHGVDTDEVEEVFNNKPQIRFVEKGKRPDENVYMAAGQTDGGRYLAVLFIHKVEDDVLILQCQRHGKMGAQTL